MCVNVLYNMVLKVIVCNKHNTDMHHTDDYMVSDNACIYALGVQRVNEVIRPVGGGGGGGVKFWASI